jgi:hypothetical protein
VDQAEIFRSERAKGASIGATIVCGFGAAWLALGMISAGVPLRVALAMVVPVFVLIAFLGSAVRRRLPKLAAAETPEKKQMMRTFNMVNIAQWVAIFGVVNLLRFLHLDAWIVSSIVLIVGAHFIPLARIFQAPQHLKTGIAMMLCAAVAVVLPVSVRDIVECLGAGLILWVSAAGALYAAFRLVSRPAFASQAGV